MLFWRVFDVVLVVVWVFLVIRGVIGLFFSILVGLCWFIVTVGMGFVSC